ENSTVSGIQGTGLGMEISKNFVDMMGGSISLTSKKGAGTEFVVLLDFRTADGPAPYPAIPELDGARALVVDGDAEACRNLVGMLRELGMRGECCASGREAFDRIGESLRTGEPFKVFVVDLKASDMAGVEAARRIREAAGKDAFIIVADDLDDAENGSENADSAVLVPPPIFKSDLQKALLKLCGKAVPDRTDREDPAFSLKGKKILLVDDSELNLKIGVLLLKEHGMLVDTARNGKIAVDTITENGVDAYDFIVMDVQMPVMDGYEATAALRKLQGGDTLKIFAISANAFEEEKEKSLKAGMNGHITKPLKINDLLNALKQFAG
ncbi:MAG: response regulator, partial [Lentisphaeria bacterium]|nr:response regulator [Lentisphaeria bacterium]